MAEKLAKEARNSISTYCFEECKAYCCRNGYLSLNQKELDTMIQGRQEELEDKGTLMTADDGKYAFALGEGGCPSLKDFKCTIHKNPNRTSACKEFPVFIHGKTIKISPRCPAFKKGKLDSYIKKFKELGYEVGELRVHL